MGLIPKLRLNSLLNWEELSYPTREAVSPTLISCSVIKLQAIFSRIFLIY